MRKRGNRPLVPGIQTRVVPVRLLPGQIDALWSLALANDRGLSGEIRTACKEHLRRHNVDG